MSEVNLCCNVFNCRKSLTGQAYVTSCSHVFCTDHGKHMMKKDNAAKCIACDSTLTGQYDILLIDLNPTDQYKSMVITGLNPDQILEIASKALSFFMYQLHFQIRTKDLSMSKLVEQKEILKNYNVSVTDQYKRDLLQMEKTIKILRRELEEKEKEIEMHKQHILQSNRIHKKLQAQVDSYKRELITIRTAEKQNLIEHSEQNDHSSKKSPFLFVYQKKPTSPFSPQEAQEEEIKQSRPFPYLTAHFGGAHPKHHRGGF